MDNATDTRHVGATANTPRDKVTRKDFMAKSGMFACIGGVMLGLIGSLRSAFPSVLPDPSQKFKIGNAMNYTLGLTKEFKDENVIVFRDDEGFYAISTVCTHLGCIVQKNASGFQCPCHGSRFAPDGKLVRGPAPKALAWLHIATSPSGQLVVDRAKQVNRGTKYSFQTTQDA